MLNKFSNAVLILFITLWSCKSDSNNIIIKINPENAIEKIVFLSEFTDNISYIPLDNQILFQHPNRIEVTKDNFIMATFPGNILCFDREGNFINEIGSKGRGPGEYNFGLFLTVDSENELIYIYDRPKIISYTFSGEFVREFSIHEFDGYFQDIYYSNGKLFLAGALLYGRPTYDWLILDTLGNLYFQKNNSIPEFKTSYPGNSRFLISENDILYWNNANDTIFQIQGDSFQPAMYFAPGDYRWPHQVIPLEDVGKYFNPRLMINTKSCLFIGYDLKKQLYSSYINKVDGYLKIIGKTKSISLFDLPGIPNDIDEGPAFPPLYYFQENGEEFLIGWIHAYRLKAHAESEAFKISTPKYPEKKQELEKLAANLDEIDNPVLMLVKLKE
jgi:hypothetical protein